MGNYTGLRVRGQLKKKNASIIQYINDKRCSWKDILVEFPELWTENFEKIQQA